MKKRYFVATLFASVQTDDIADALRAEGHAVKVIETRRWGFGSFNAELAVAPNGTRVIIDFSGDLHTAWDIETSIKELLAEVLPEHEIPPIRQFFEIRYWPHADPAVIEFLTHYLCRVSVGRRLE